MRDSSQFASSEKTLYISIGKSADKMRSMARSSSFTAITTLTPRERKNRARLRPRKRCPIPRWWDASKQMRCRMTLSPHRWLYISPPCTTPGRWWLPLQNHQRYPQSDGVLGIVSLSEYLILQCENDEVVPVYIH